MPGTAFATGNWDGYDEQSVTNPASALTDFTLVIDVSRMSATWKSTVQSDGADIRVTKGDDTEIPYALIDWAYNAGSPTGLIFAKWSGTLASSGTQNVRVWVGYTPGTATAYDATETYGSDNAFASHIEHYSLGGGTDFTSNAANGTANGGVTLEGGTGLLGAATDFDGSDDYVTLGTLGGLTTAYTVMAWVKHDTETADQAAFGHVAISTPAVQLWRDENTTDRYGGYHQDSGGARVIYGTTNPGTAWRHVALRYNSAVTTITLFVDGASEASNTSAGAPIETPDWVVGANLGTASPSKLMDGLIHLVQISSSALTADRIALEEAQGDQATFWGTWGWNGAAPAQTLSWTNGVHTDKVEVYYTDTPAATPDTLLTTLTDLASGAQTHDLGSAPPSGRRFAVLPVNTAPDTEEDGTLSNVVEAS